MHGGPIPSYLLPMSTDRKPAPRSKLSNAQSLDPPFNEVTSHHNSPGVEALLFKRWNPGFDPQNGQSPNGATQVPPTSSPVCETTSTNEGPSEPTSLDKRNS